MWISETKRDTKLVKWKTKIHYISRIRWYQKYWCSILDFQDMIKILFLMVLRILLIWKNICCRLQVFSESYLIKWKLFKNAMLSTTVYKKSSRNYSQVKVFIAFGIENLRIQCFFKVDPLLFLLMISNSNYSIKDFNLDFLKFLNFFK